PLGPDDRAALEHARRFSGPRFLLPNKIDLIPKATLLPLIDSLSRECDFAGIIPISALTGNGLPLLLDRLIAHLPEAPPYFPADLFTDQPERFLAAEFLREKVLAATRQEVPHAVAVLVDSFEEGPRLVRIRATVYVERDGQKAIVIGRGGAMLKHIGTAARKELEELLGVKVFLEVYVKVQRNWRQRPALVRQLDWRRQLEHLSKE
ncbi:MAG TPA: GTPase Era, partial [Candidatus Acidoferrales bacterium]|nr:GTPase Era [Candidatus Acidoferrales bacterium]